MKDDLPIVKTEKSNLKTSEENEEIIKRQRMKILFLNVSLFRKNLDYKAANELNHYLEIELERIPDWIRYFFRK